ncbi:MAG: translocation/assembly module TamB domain-containing protein [Bacteroidetes bacterium]|nr:translocation/assembly module TamB domain-containing protein [Bacteroidota bacterium]
MLKKLLKISGSFFLGLLIFLIAWWLFSRINSSFADKIFNFSSPISWFIFAIATGILILVHIQKAGWTNRALRTLGIAFLSLLFIVCASVLFVNSDAGQNILTKAVTNHFSKELKTKISLRHISLSLLNKMNLEGFYVEDQQKDTLLYAGKLSVRITDWFVFKDKTELEYLELEDAVIKMQRSDSIWNYNFISAYFSSPLPADTGKSSKGIVFNLKKIQLKNIYFLQKDGWRGRDMTTRFASLELEANNIDINKKKIDLSLIEIDKPLFSIYDYDGKRPDSLAPKKELKRDSLFISSLKWNPDDWSMNIRRLKINQGNFKNDVETDRAPYSYFDGKHIDFSSIDAVFENFKLNKDTITGRLSLSTKERSGFEVKSMTADAKVTPNEMSFYKLSLRTNNSVIKDFYAMKYNEFDDMNDYIHAVVMQANFDDSEIDSDDITFFAPELQSWKKKILVNGKVRGTVDDITGREIKIQAGNNSYLSGDITMTGLPDINQTFIDFKANDFRTTYSDAVKFFPGIRQTNGVDLSKLSYLHFNGSFTGFIRDFVTFGTIQTNLGTIRSDLNMKLPEGKEPVYSGHIGTSNFQLGTFLNERSVGTISFDSEVKGKSFNLNKLIADLDGKIKSVEYNNYVYHNIETKGILNKKVFDGLMSMNDSNAKFSLNGLLDFSGKAPKFKLTADVQKLNLQQLKLANDNLAVNGKFNLNFSGNNIDDFLGTAKITEASLFRDSTRLSFDSLIVSAGYIEGVKTFSAKSNEFEAKLKGDFRVNDLDKTVQLFLHRYYPAYIDATKYTGDNNTRFSFSIKTKNVEEYIKILDKRFTGFNNSSITGTVNLSENKLDLIADIPSFAYKQYSFSNSRLLGNGNLDSLVVYALSNNITINDSLTLPMATARIIAHNDTSRVQITTGANQTLDMANINASMQTFSNGFSIRFDPSEFIINGKKWNIEKNGSLDFRNNYVVGGEVLLKESNQEIRLATRPSAEGNWADLEAVLTDVNMGDFSPFLMKSNRLEGLLSGRVNIEDPYKRLYITGDLQGTQVRLDNDSLGKVNVTDIIYNNQTGQLTGKAKNNDPDHPLNVDLNLFVKEDDSVNAKNNHISIATKNYPIKILNRFLNTLFTDLEGYASTSLDITGDFSNLNYVGKATLHNAGLRVKFTQCFYKIEDGDVELKADAIDFGGLKIIDKAGKTATIERGVIQHQSFRNMFFDIQVRTDDEPMELLNTTFNDNQSFYGRAKGTGSFFLSGPESDMIMEVYAKASNKDSAFITMPSTTSRETGIADFLVEKKYGREMSDSSIRSADSKITYDVELNANPMVNIRMILDELTGDEIKARGGGTLKIHAGTTEKLTLRGRYEIEEGNYLFTFQSFFKKPLVVKSGGNNYIEWNGDPLKANVHLEAQYIANNVSFSPLVEYTGIQDYNTAKTRGDVYVITTLTGQLFKPDIAFRIEFPPGSEANSNSSLGFGVQQIQKNPNELYKQVTYLIVFNSFAPVDSRGVASTAGISLGATATNTLSGIFFNVINNEFNKILNKLLKSDKYHINITNTVYNRNFIDPNNTALNLGNNFNISVGRKFFNDRFILNFGGGIEAPLSQNTTNVQQNVQLLPDVTAEWLINQSGTIRAVFFYKENTDFLNTSSSGTLGRTKRSGASLSYRREFNSLGTDDDKKKQKPAPQKADAKKDEEEKQKDKGN